MNKEAALAQSTFQHVQDDGDDSSPGLAYHLSGPLLGLVGSAFVSGLFYGFFQFLQRSPIRHEHVPGTAAWGPHLALAVAALVIFGVAWWWHRQRFGARSGRLWLLAPLGRNAAGRVARTLGFGSRRAQLGRLLLVLPVAALFLFCFWRAGAQVTGGLDPNFTVNAWGGPTYVGALACHYLDLFLVASGAAWLMDRILPA